MAEDDRYLFLVSAKPITRPVVVTNDNIFPVTILPVMQTKSDLLHQYITGQAIPSLYDTYSIYCSRFHVAPEQVVKRLGEKRSLTMMQQSELAMYISVHSKACASLHVN